MVSQGLMVQPPQWHYRHGLAASPDLLPPGAPYDAIDMAILRLSKLVSLAAPASLESRPSSTSSESSSSEEGNHNTNNMEVLPVAFAPSRLDPVYIPTQDDFISRCALSLRIPDERRFCHPVSASDIDTRLFRGFLRTMVADRPFYDPCGPPEWTAEYNAVFEICRRIYVQRFTQEGHSMLHRVRIINKGELAELRVLTESVIGQPSVYQYRTVRIFDEEIPYSETGFSPLPPSRPFCGRPAQMPHRPNCLCPIYWPNVTLPIHSRADAIAP